MAILAEMVYRNVENNYEMTDFFPEKELTALLQRVYNNCDFYQDKFNNCGFKPSFNISYEEFTKLPFTEKHELRNGEPMSILAVDEEEVVRIHSTSGTTGKAVMVPYTQKDIDDWAEMMKRCFELAGLTKKDRVQITPGYGLWTAGIGFQAGVEKLGAMAIPIGPGNTQKQLEMMTDLKSSVLIGTSSYGLLLAEEIHAKGLKDKLKLKTGIFGSERWGEKMRDRIEELLGIETFDIYGLTEVYGPGIALDCKYHQGMHYFSDYLFMEIIDPITEEPLPPGELGELVITTLTKEAMPLIRFRTRDLTRIILEPCPCGCQHPRLDRILGRSDDRIKVKGVNIYPGQIENLLKEVNGINCEYQIHINRHEGRENLLIKIEREKDSTEMGLEQEIEKRFKQKIGVQVDVEIVDYGVLPRSEKKTKRVFDTRE